MTIGPRQPVRYPDLYTWLVFAAALDVMFTYLILYIGGIEVNRLAAGIMQSWGFHGMVVYKFALILFIIVLCEIIGRRDQQWGWRLGAIGITLTFAPVVLAMLLLAGRAHHYF